MSEEGKIQLELVIGTVSLDELFIIEKIMARRNL